MEWPTELLTQLNVPTLVAMAFMVWWLKSNQDKKLEVLMHNLDNRFDKIDQRFEKVDHRFDRMNDRIEALDSKLTERINVLDSKLSEKINDVDRRLCRLEGAFASKDCCMIKDSRQEKNVG